MPPKRSTRAVAAATTTATTRTRTTRAASSAAPSPAAATVDDAHSTTTTTTKTAGAPSRKAKHLAVAQLQQLDGVADGPNANSADDSDSLAISTRPARLFRRAGKVANAEPVDYTMTGALGEGDVAGAHVAAMKVKQQQQQQQQQQNQNQNRNVRTRGTRGVMRGGVTKQRTADPEQARAMEALRRRREEAMGPVGKKGEVEKEDDTAERGRRQEVPGTASRVRRASSSHWNNPVSGSAVKAQGTPAAERSVLALTKFKKRRRQGSLLRMMQQSDVEDASDDDEGLDDSAATLDYSLGDFEPENESTPLNMGKRGAMAAALPAGFSEPRTSSSRKRKLAERDYATEKRSEVLVPRSSPPVADEQVDAVDDGAESSSSEHLYSEASDHPQQVISETQPEPEEDEDELPRSTSPLSSVPADLEPEEELPAKRPRRTTTTSNKRASQRAHPYVDVEENAYAADPLSTSDLEGSDTATETPTRTISRTKITKKNARKPKKALALSTATLQSLLPRRRRKAATRTAKTAAAGTFEIPSSSSVEEEQEEEPEAENDEEDELQRPVRRGRGKTAAAKASDSTVRGKKTITAAAAAAAAKKEKTAANKKRLSRTYGRRSSDKENQDAGEASMYVRSDEDDDADGDDVIETSEMKEQTAKSKELDAAARKFREIDEWEMDFESVDMGGASASSPWR